jgi:hypothetical protein
LKKKLYRIAEYFNNQPIFWRDPFTNKEFVGEKIEAEKIIFMLNMQFGSEYKAVEVEE